MKHSATDKELRILILEDSTADADLMKHELRKGGMTFISKRVDTRATFINAIESFQPDVILADYKLPDFDGMAALEIVRRDHPEIPVIIVTGALSDIGAMDMVHAGAKDYVLKDRLGRLGTAIKRALLTEHGIRARKLAEKVLRESEMLYHSVFNSMVEGVVLQTAKGKITTVNQAADRFEGISVQEILGLTSSISNWQAIHEDGTAFSEIDHPSKVALRTGLSQSNVVMGIRKSDGPLSWISINSQPLKFPEERLPHAVVTTFHDITKRKEAEEQLRSSAGMLANTLAQTIDAIAAMIEARDPYTAGHQRRVAALASAIALEMGFPPDKIYGLGLAATIHDLGKIHLPAEILSKPGALKPIEFELIKTHSQAGYDIIRDVQFPWPIAQMVLQHHERLNGSGYPQGLTGEQILPEAKILAVADVVEAMSTHRPYRAALGVDAALAEISRLRGLAFDPDVVDCCIVLFTAKGFDFT